ncbi:BglG family transcription antiterminator [Dellaglioa sp. L3N]
MEMSKRQIQIVTQLVNEHGWLTSEKIAKNIGTSKKTIQFEMKILTNEFDKYVVLQSNKRTGYRIESISDDFKKYIIEEVKTYESYSSMNARASAIIIFLLFQKAYVSMQYVADIFFLSKTAVSIEIKTIQRWMARNSEISIDISGNDGLKMIATENMKRIFGSMVGTEKVMEEAHLEKNEVQLYIKLVPIIKKVVRETLIRYKYVVSGEDFKRINRYIIISIVRQDAGWKITEEIKMSENLPLVTYLVHAMEDELDISFDSLEKKALANRLLDFNYLYGDGDTNEQIDSELRLFEQKIISTLNLPTNSLFQESEFLVSHIKQMKIRIASGHNAMNHFAKKTAQNYPLETHLIKKYFPTYFMIKPNNAETAYLVLYLAAALEQYKKTVTGLIISNQPFSILNTLNVQINELLGHQGQKFNIEPVYLYEIQSENIDDYDVILTTEQEIIFENSRFIFLSSVLDENEMDNLSNLLVERIQILREYKKKQLLDKYFVDDNKIEVYKKISNYQDLLPKIKETTTQLIGDETLLICLVEEKATTKILQFNLHEYINYHQKKIKRIIYAEYDTTQNNSLLFFYCIVEILK